MTKLTSVRWNHRVATVAIALSAAASAIAQLFLGADPLVLGLAIIGIAIGLWGFAVVGPRNLGAWTLLFYVLGNVIVALWAKTLMGQSIQSNLEAPLTAFGAIDVGCFALLLALLIAERIPVGHRILRPQLEPGFLRFLSWASYALGCVFWILNRWSLDPDAGSGFGGFSLFVSLFLMAVIARTAYRSVLGLPRVLDLPICLMILSGIATGLIDNTKTGVALPALSFFVAALFFRGRLSKPLLLASVAAAVVFVSVLGPLTHIYRAFDIQDLPLSDRVDLLRTEGSRLLSGDLSQEYSQMGGGRITEGYYDYFGEDKGQLIVGRYASVQQIDPVVSAINRSNPLGGAFVWRGLSHSLPRFLDPNKSQDNEAFDVVFALGLVNATAGKNPTVPLVAEAYAGSGIIGLLFIPLATFLFFLVAAKKVGWDLRRNVYAIFFFCQFIVVYANQGDFAQYTGEVLRGFPVFVLIFLGLERTYRMVSRRRVSAIALSRPA